MSYKISIVTVVLNAEKHIEKTLRSLISQTYPNKEYIVIDGKSVDGTLEIINKYREKIDILVSEPDHGIYDAMNKAIERATGDWLIFMNAGDYFYDRHTLSAVFTPEANYDNVDVLFGDTIVKLGDFYYKLSPPENFDPHSYHWAKMPFSHQAVFVRTALHKQHLFDCRYRIVADWNLFRKLASEQFTFQHIELPICRYNYEGFSSTNTLLSLQESAEVLQQAAPDWRLVLKYKIRACLASCFPKFFLWQWNSRLRHNPKYPEREELKWIEQSMFLNLPENRQADTLAPVVLFCYKRLSCLQQTVNALQKNKLADKSRLFVFADGAKNTDEQAKIDEVRAYLKTIAGFASIEIYESDENMGLANSIINGVTKIIKQFGKIIVLEDDIVTVPFFLQWMNDAIDYYENSELIAGVQAWCPPMKNLDVETFFIREVGCWGWATWRRGWELFNADGEELLLQIENRHLCHDFDVFDSHPYCQMLRDQIQGRVDSWAIRWYASVFLAGKLGLQPGRQLVHNNGFDSGTHFDGKVNIVQSQLAVLPPIIGIDNEQYSLHLVKKVFIPFHKQILHCSILSRISKKLKKILMKRKDKR